jgi:hypothetical protein
MAALRFEQKAMRSYATSTKAQLSRMEQRFTTACWEEIQSLLFHRPDPTVPERQMAVEQHLTPLQVTTLLGFDQEWFYIHAEEFVPFGLVKLNGRWRLPESGLTKWIKAHNELAGEKAKDAVKGFVKEERERLAKV